MDDLRNLSGAKAALEKERDDLKVRPEREYVCVARHWT